MLFLPDDGLDGDGQRIFLFPAWPRQWDVSFKFLAQNQTSVQGELVGGKLRSLIVTPESRTKDVVNLLKSDDDSGPSGIFLLAEPGESCEAACGLAGRDCSQHVVTRQDIAGIWVALFQECQQYRCGQDTGNSTAAFAELGVRCRELPATMRNVSTWSRRDQPCFVTDPVSTPSHLATQSSDADRCCQQGDPLHGACLGWRGVPNPLSCQWSSWNTSRLCRCAATNTHQWHFGTGFTGGEVETTGWWTNETYVFGHAVEPGHTGVITHLWTTTTPACEPDYILRYYIDGEKQASLEFTPAMANGVGFDAEKGDQSDGAPWSTKWFGLGAGNHRNRYNKTGQAWWSNIRIPFQRSVRVSLQNRGCANPDGLFVRAAALFFAHLLESQV